MRIHNHQTLNLTQTLTLIKQSTCHMRHFDELTDIHSEYEFLETKGIQHLQVSQKSIPKYIL